MRTRLRPIVVLITALLLALASMGLATPAAAGAFHGDVKIHNNPSETDVLRSHDPKICGAFHIHGTNFDLSSSGWWKIYNDWSGPVKPDPVREGSWTTTRTSGDWESESITLLNGHYKLEFDYSSDETSGNAKSKVFKVSCGENPPPGGTGTLDITKLNDTDGDGDVADTDAGLSGWMFQIMDGSTIVATSAATDAQGNTSVDVPVGTYTISEVLGGQTGWSVTSVIGDIGTRSGSTITGVVVGKNDRLSFTFRNHYTQLYTPEPQVGTLNVIKFNDFNRNGAQDNGEPTLSGVGFQVKLGGTTQLTITTNASGLAAATLTPGTYSIVEIPQVGWTATTAVIQGATIVDRQTTVVRFGNVQAPIIPPTTATQLTITKYLDANANGVRDSGEATLAGFSFLVKSTDGAVSQTITTDASGVASIANLPLGGYSATEIATNGYTNTDPGGNATKYFAFATGSTTASLSFGNAEVKLPSTSTDPNTMGLALSLTLMGGFALMFVMARRASRLS